ncbi:MAG: ADP-ribosylglycohydrolase family protein [Bryobacterales bacterium]|nr:ADP-ribosylglycohydrolase family protein [Bryobacterales bacterium]
MDSRSNRAIFEELSASGGIRVRPAPFFSKPPEPLPPGFDFTRVEGMLLGLAIGDALGNTSEGMSAGDRRSRYGEIRDYVNGQADPSDDTQLAFWTLEQMIADGGFFPEKVARRFTQDSIRGIGNTVKHFVAAHRAGRPWHRCADRSAGNGALMRIAPVLVPHLRAPSAGLWIDTALCAMITHNDSAAIASCVAFVEMLWRLLGMDLPPRPEWWLETFVAALKELETGEPYSSGNSPLQPFRGPLWELLEQELPPAFARGMPVVDNPWYSGAFLLQTVPCVLYILMRHGHDPEEAIVRAVNDTWDNDTIAAIVGAAAGALHGRGALPRRWIQGLPGRTRDGDDGRIYQLLAQARQSFYVSPGG